MSARRVPSGSPPPPPVQKLRVRYARRGRLRFTSSRDFSRALERALRRAGLPVAYSAGFHPHPKISYAGGAPTGAISEAEYFEFSVTEPVEPETVRAVLDRALPDGLDIEDVVIAGPGSLAERLQASHWELAFAADDRPGLEAAIEVFVHATEAKVTRTFASGVKTYDTRSAVVSHGLSPEDGSGYAILSLVVRHTIPAVRPGDVLTAMQTVAGFVPTSPPLVTRRAQGPLTAAATVADPLAADRDFAGD